MSQHGSCNHCAFFDDGMKAAAAQTEDGLCRYNPPVTQPSPNEHGLWPVVSASDWCGHFTSEQSVGQIAAE